MCMRFVFRGDNDIITGFNFDIDLEVWDHRLIFDDKRFYIGILRSDGLRHCYHGVNTNGNVGTLLYVHGNDTGVYCADADCITIADFTEAFINGTLGYDEAKKLLGCKTITYAPDATMQAMLSDKRGRTLIIEPGIGWREETSGQYSLITNYSLIDPQSTAPYIVPGDERYERAQSMLSAYSGRFEVTDAFRILDAVCQDEPWATRVSFVYSARDKAVYVCENGDFDNIMKKVL